MLMVVRQFLLTSSFSETSLLISYLKKFRGRASWCLSSGNRGGAGMGFLYHFDRKFSHVSQGP